MNYVDVDLAVAYYYYTDRKKLELSFSSGPTAFILQVSHGLDSSNDNSFQSLQPRSPEVWS